MTLFRFESLTLTVDDVMRSVVFYQTILGLEVSMHAAPAFALICCAAKGTSTIGIFPVTEAIKAGGQRMSPAQNLGTISSSRPMTSTPSTPI